MLPDRDRDRHQLFQFAVPGLPNTPLALGLPEVLAITSLPPLAPVPLTLPFVSGLAEWQGSIVTVVDLATVLRGDAGNGDALARTSHAPHQHYLIAQVIVEAQREVVAWPVSPGAGMLSVPSQAPRAEAPPHLSPAMIRAAISLSNRTLVLLNLEGIATQSQPGGR